MDYETLTARLMKALYCLYHNKPHNNVQEAVQGTDAVRTFLFMSKQEQITPGDISTMLDVTSARVAVMLKSLEKKGEIRRDFHPTDRRQVIVTLTPKGEELAKQKQDLLYNHIRYLLTALGEEDGPEFIRILERLPVIFKDAMCQVDDIMTDKL